jgi:uncharacterized protein
MTAHPPTFGAAITQFNQHQFYECHDTLEAIWVEAPEPLRKFYQGILQIAVACYHLGNGNQRGAMILLGEGMSRLSAYQPQQHGIDISQLLDESADLLAQLQAHSLEQQTDPAAITDSSSNSITRKDAVAWNLPTIQRSTL